MSMFVCAHVDVSVHVHVRITFLVDKLLSGTASAAREEEFLLQNRS